VMVTLPASILTLTSSYLPFVSAGFSTRIVKVWSLVVSLVLDAGGRGGGGPCQRGGAGALRDPRGPSPRHREPLRPGDFSGRFLRRERLADITREAPVRASAPPFNPSTSGGLPRIPAGAAGGAMCRGLSGRPPRPGPGRLPPGSLPRALPSGSAAGRSG